MTNTWVGTAADRWGADFHGRMAALTRLLDQLPAEERRVIAAAQKDQKAMDTRYHGHS